MQPIGSGFPDKLTGTPRASRAIWPQSWYWSCSASDADDHGGSATRFATFKLPGGRSRMMHISQAHDACACPIPALALHGGQTAPMLTRLQAGQRAGGRLRVALAAPFLMLYLKSAAAQTVIANSQLQTCIASGSVHSPDPVSCRGWQGAAWISTLRSEHMRFCAGVVIRCGGVHARRWTRRWAARRSW